MGSTISWRLDELFNYDVAIYYGPGNTEDELAKTFQSDIWIHLCADKVVLVCDDNVPSAEFMQFHPSVTMVRVFDCQSVLESFNSAVTYMKASYFVFIIAGFQLDWEWLSRLHSLVEIKRVGLVEPDDDGNGLVIIKELYEGVHGTSETSVINKIKTVALEQGCLDILYDYKLLNIYTDKEMADAATAYKNSLSE